MDGREILVTGATGQQGGAVARHLLAAGCKLRALVRDPNKEAAQALARQGVELRQGDLFDRASLDAAVQGAYGVFSVQNYWLPGVGFEGEIKQGTLLADASAAAGVQHFVYSSVGAANRGEGQKHFECKWIIEQHLRELDLPWTVVRPVAFMDNQAWAQPQISNGTFTGLGLRPDKAQQLVAVDDIGAYVAIIFSNPQEFIGRTLELAGDELTEPQMAETLAKVIGRPVAVQSRHKPGGYEPNEEMAAMIRFFNGEAYSADIPGLRQRHPGLRTFEQYLRENGWEHLPVLPIPANGGWGQS